MIIDRIRDGLIWSYAALTLAEEQRAKRQERWERERIRFREEARTRLDTLLREMEERRANRQQWVRDRVRETLDDAGLARSEEVAALQTKIAELQARIATMESPIAPVATPPASPPDVPPAAEDLTTPPQGI